MTKRIVALLLAGLLTLPLFACGTSENKTEEGGSGSQTTTKTNEEQLQAFIRDYRDGKYSDKMLFLYDDLTEYFELANYKGIEYPDDPSVSEEVADSVVEDYLTSAVLNAKVSDDQYTEITDGVLQKWDVVTIDYKGVMDGEEIKRATAENEELLLGSGAYLQGFETGLIGKEFDKEIRLDLHFSPYYSAKDMADRDITFYVTVKKVQRPTIPEITVEILNEIYSTKFASMDEVKAELKKDMIESQKGLVQSNLSSYLEYDIIGRSTVKKYPEKELNHYKNHFVNYYTQYAQDGVTMEKFCEEELGMSYEEFMESADSYAKDVVAGTLMILSVCREENITCSDEQLKAMIEGLFENQGSTYGNMKSFVEDYSNIYGADYFELQVLSAAAMEKVKESAVKVAK